MDRQKKIQSLLLIGAALCLPIALKLFQLFIILYIIHVVATAVVYRLPFRIRKPHVPFVFFGVLHIAGVLWSADQANAWFNVEKKVLLFALPFMAALALPLNEKEISRIYKAFVAGCFVSTLICLSMALIQSTGHVAGINFDPGSQQLFESLQPGRAPEWSRLSYIGLAGSGGYHPTYLALYIVFSIAVLLRNSGENFNSYALWKKILLVALLIWFELFVAMLASRIMVAGLILTLLYFVLRPLGQFKSTVRWLTLTLVLPIGLILLNPVSAFRVVQEPMNEATYEPADNGIYTYSTGIRMALWRLSAAAIQRENLLTGSGTGDVKETIRQLSEEHHAGNAMNTFDPHSQYLYTAVGLGLPGLVVLVACLGVPLWNGYKKGDFVIICMALLFILLCCTESALEVQWGIAFFAFFGSLMVFSMSGRKAEVIL